MKRILILIALLVAQSIPSVAESREKDLDRWVDRNLIPYVRQQLLVHPRFKGETVMFVVLNENTPASSTNALALSMRDRLLAAAVDTRGVEIGWQQGRGGISLESTPGDCVHDDVHYYIGVELTQKLDGSYAVNVRALDLEDRNWVTGFGRRWQGKLSTSQRQAMRQERVDQTFLGARDVPFTLVQTDLLAAHLAHRLTCTLGKRVEHDYVVSIDLIEPPASGLEGTVELISNNLANRQALTLSADASAANAVLSGKAHQIDGVLHQYWVTVTPTGETDDVAALSASAYIVLPPPCGFGRRSPGRGQSRPERCRCNAGRDSSKAAAGIHPERWQGRADQPARYRATNHANGMRLRRLLHARNASQRRCNRVLSRTPGQLRTRAPCRRFVPRANGGAHRSPRRSDPFPDSANNHVKAQLDGDLRMGPRTGA